MTDATSASASEPRASEPGAAMTDEQLWDEMRDEEAERPDGDDDADAERRGHDDGDDGDEGDEPDGHDDGDDDQPDHEQGSSDDDGDDDPIWASATPEQRETLKKLKHDLKSAQGRARALQRARSTAPSGPPVSQEELERRRQEIARVQEEYGDVVGPIPEMLTDLNNRLEHYAQQDEAERQAILQAERDSLLERHPDFYDTLRQHGQTFQAWVDDQPRAIRDAVAANRDGIVDSDAAATVFEAFKSALQGTEPPAPNQDRLSERRRRQKAGARSTRSSMPPVSQGVPDDADPEEIWKDLARKEARERRS